MKKIYIIALFFVITLSALAISSESSFLNQERYGTSGPDQSELYDFDEDIDNLD